MKKEAVLHIPLSQYAYAADENTLVIRLRTAKWDINEAYVFYGDRVAYEEPIPVTSCKMQKCAADELFDYYEAKISTELTRVCYYFSLQSDDEKLYYYSRGFAKELAAHRTEYFQFPYIRREDIINIPEWINDSVMYHVFPDSFASGKRELAKSTKGIKSIETAKAYVSENRLGGTLRGITENLDYISGLGINLLYLNPIFMAGSYHKYDTIDYFEIDSCFGSKDDFRELVKRAHQKNIRIVLDGVFNHCGSEFFAFKDVLEKGERSEYCDWFYELNFPLQYKSPPNYECFAYVKEMPKLNTGNPLVRDYICSVGKYWIEEFDIDGWRLDVANEVDHDTWRAFRRAVREVKPDAFLIAEIWEDAGVWLMGDQFDSAMNYTFTYLCRDFFATGKIGAREFDEQIQKSLMRYPWQVACAQMNFLDSHDVPRFLHYCGGNVKRLELAFFYLIMAPGIPSVFYGDECLISGFEEEEYRAAMAWENADNDFSEKLKKWIKLRKGSNAIKRGNYRGIYTDEEGLYVFCREYRDEKIYVFINNSERERVIDLKKICGEKTGNELCIEPFGGIVA